VVLETKPYSSAGPVPLLKNIKVCSVKVLLNNLDGFHIRQDRKPGSQFLALLSSIIPLEVLLIKHLVTTFVVLSVKSKRYAGLGSISMEVFFTPA